MKAKEIEQLFAEICKSLNTSTPRIDLPSYNEMMSSFKKMCPYHQFDDGCEKPNLEEGFVWGYLTCLAQKA